MKPVLFFDIDGCLHPQTLPKIDQNGKIARHAGDGLFCWSKPFEEILERFENLDLICHSNWRKHLTFDELLSNLPRIIADRTRDVTPANLDRHQSILSYCREHSVADHLIMDDDLWAFPHNYSPLVWLPEEKGLSLSKSAEDLQQRVSKLCEVSKKQPHKIKSSFR